MTTAARERWRAELEELTAQKLRSVGLDDMAAPKEANAELRRAFAAVNDRYDETRPAYLAEVARARQVAAIAALDWKESQALTDYLVRLGIDDPAAFAALRDVDVRLGVADFINKDITRPHEEAAAELADMRRVWRKTGEALGTRAPVGTIDNFAEPGDEEL